MVVLIALSLYYSSAGGGDSQPDRGLALCKTWSAPGTGNPSLTPTQLLDGVNTERADFAASQYADVRSTGTRLMDLFAPIFAAQVNGNMDQAQQLYLSSVGEISAAYGQVVDACAAHSFTLPPPGTVLAGH